MVVLSSAWIRASRCQQCRDFGHGLEFLGFRFEGGEAMDGFDLREWILIWAPLLTMAWVVGSELLFCLFIIVVEYGFDLN